MNNVQKLLLQIGGTAQLVAGHDGHFWADASTPEKSHVRPFMRNDKRIRGDYGSSLKTHFDTTRFQSKAAKKQSRTSA